jgi:hypothetical protein
MCLSESLTSERGASKRVPAKFATLAFIHL